MDKENIAKVIGKDLPISTKFSVEICNFIRYKNTKKAKEMMQRVSDMKDAVPMKRFGKDLAHKPGKIAGGRYPLKASKYFLDLLNALEKNAENKGLNVELLNINFAVANKGAKQWHYGRKRRRAAKRTNVELRAIEKEVKKEKTKEKKAEKK